MFQHDLEHDVPDIPAAIENLFEDLVEVLINDDVDDTMIAIIKLPETVEHELVAFAFDKLELIILSFDAFQITPLRSSLTNRTRVSAALASSSICLENSMPFTT